MESISEHFMPGKFVVITFVFVPPDLVMVHMEDITERKQAEESLREAELKFRTIFDSASDGILLFNVGEEKFSAANEKICNMLGYTNEELLNLSINDIHPQEAIPFVTDQLEKLLNKEVFIVRDLPVIRKDKTVFFADITGSPITLGEKEFVIGIFRDITERKQAEEAVKVNHAQMLAIFDAIDEPVYVADTETYEMLYINRATNLAWGDTQNRKCHEYLQHRDSPCPFCTNTKILGKYFGRSYVWEFQNKINQRWYRCIDKAIPWPNGRIVRYEMAIDITERKKTEDELKKYREHLEDLVQERTIKLEAANKELESFSYSASHDLRAPLRTIEGFSQALLEDCEDKLDLHGRDYLKRIITATRHMTLLIEDMLKLSRITRTEMNIDKVNLTQIARSIINELKESQPQRHVEIKIADGLEDEADTRLMRILLENLLDNAWKFTGNQANAVIEFGFTKKGEKKIYFVHDNGAGFDMMYVDKLFAPFQRLHSFDEYPGTGIGLATVQRIINRHGGKAWTEGQVGKGATFYFTLKEH
jgi:PAS domain S-box-containing protein